MEVNILKKRHFYLVVFLMFFMLNSAYSKSGMNYYSTENGLQNLDIKKIFIDPGQFLWILEENNLDVKTSGGPFLNFYAYTPLSRRNISDISFEYINSKDINNYNVGAIWFATDKGILKLDRHGKWTILTKESHNLPGDDITTIVVDRFSSVICTTKYGLIFKITKEGKVIPWKTPLDVGVNCSFAQADGTVYFGTAGKGVYRLKNIENSNEFVVEEFIEATSLLIPSNSINDIEIDDKEYMWICTNMGLTRYNLRNQKSILYKTLENKDVTVCRIDSFGQKWIGTRTDGIYTIEGESTVVLQPKVYMAYKVSGICIDRHDNIWVGTDKGLVEIIPEREKGASVPSIAAYSIGWNPKENPQGDIDFKFGLPAGYYGKTIWEFSVFSADGSYNFKDPGYLIVSDAQNNMYLNIKGEFENVNFTSCSVVDGQFEKKVVDENASYPFPETYPMELQKYLDATEYIPASEKSIKVKALELIKSTSKNDMYDTAKDLLYSSLFINMPFDIDLLTKQETSGLETKDLRGFPSRSASEILKQNIGTTYEKSRLFVALSRASGIPARLVFENGFNVFPEIWINKLGWIPVEVSHPLFNYICGPDRFTLFKDIEWGSDYNIISVSGANDDGFFSWEPKVLATVKHDFNTDKIVNFDKIEKCKLIITKPSEIDNLPYESLIPVSSNIKIAVLEDEKTDEYSIGFYEKQGNPFKKIKIETFNESHEIEVPEGKSFTFIPRISGEYLILEILFWR